MRVVIVVTLSILAFCSGRPQNGCPGDVDCDDPTTTPPPETTTYDHDGDDMGDGMEHTHGASAKAKGLVRQGDIRRPFPIPVAAPRPPPGPFPGPVPRDRVAFSVRKGEISGANNRVRFEEVLTNVGRGWSQGRSHFDAPYSGGYYFSFHAVAERNRDFTMSLMKNGVYQVTAYGTRGEYEHGSNSVFLELRRGQRVHLELQDGTIYEHPGGEAYTTFTGFMLYEN